MSGDVEIRVGRFVGEIGRIDSAFLGYEDHGVWALNLGFDFAATHQGLGYIGLGNETSGVQVLQALTKVIGPITSCVGRQVIVLRDSDTLNEPIRGVRSLIEDRQVIWADFFK